MDVVSPTGTEIRNKRLSEELRHYQMLAINTLGGPGRHHWNSEMAMKLAAGAHAQQQLQFRRAAMEMVNLHTKERKVDNTASATQGLPFDFKIPTPFPIQQMPIMMPADNQSCEQSETALQGEKIACFDVGGEKRLCLPQILNTVLKEFTLDIINKACDELHIYCSRCHPEQLESFKETRILPITAPSCGLITKTDSERLCSMLLHSSGSTFAVRSELGSSKPSVNCLPVYHECFGEGHGFLREKLFTNLEARCVECAECERLFSLRQFVSHSHVNQETSICHWGFDSNNWKHYLLFASDRVAENDQENLENVFNTLIEKFSRAEISGSFKKRKFSDNDLDSSPMVKSKREIRPSPTSWYGMPTFPRSQTPWSYSINPALQEPVKSRNFVRSATSHLTDGPPKLANPERVVSSSETNRYEKHFVPNIALQPSSSPAAKITAANSVEQQEPSDAAENRRISIGSSSEESSDGSDNEVESVDKSKDIGSKLTAMHTLMLELLSRTDLAHGEQKEYQQKYENLDDGIRQHIRDISAESAG